MSSPSTFEARDSVISHTRLANLPDMMSLATYDRLRNVIGYCTKLDWPAWSRIAWSWFGPRSPSQCLQRFSGRVEQCFCWVLPTLLSQCVMHDAIVKACIAMKLTFVTNVSAFQLHPFWCRIITGFKLPYQKSFGCVSAAPGAHEDILHCSFSVCCMGCSLPILLHIFAPN